MGARAPHGKRAARLVAAVAGGALLAAGCAATTTDPGATGDTGNAYRLMVISGQTQGPVPIQPFPETVTGAEAATKQINDAGGVNGHRIEIVPCDTKWDSNAAVACARRAVDEGFLAVVGGSDVTVTSTTSSSAPRCRRSRPTRSCAS